VAFGTNLLCFVHTYDVAKRAEASLSIGADLRITPAQSNPPPVPPLQSPTSPRPPRCGLTPLFSFSPALVAVPIGSLALLVAAIVATSALAIGLALGFVARLRTVTTLRDS